MGGVSAIGSTSSVVTLPIYLIMLRYFADIIWYVIKIMFNFSICSVTITLMELMLNIYLVHNQNMNHISLKVDQHV